MKLWPLKLEGGRRVAIVSGSHACEQWQPYLLVTYNWHVIFLGAPVTLKSSQGHQNWCESVNLNGDYHHKNTVSEKKATLTFFSTQDGLITGRSLHRHTWCFIGVKKAWNISKWWGGSIGRALNSRSKDPGFKPWPRQEQKNNWWEFFRVKKCYADSLSECPTPVCIHTHTNRHVHTLKILLSMSEFGGLRKHKKTQHALVALGSAALVAAVALPR